MKNSLSVIIISRNAQELIGDCIKSADWADEVILVDTGSEDKTVEIARRLKARVARLDFCGFDFSGWRNHGLKLAKGDWVFYLDTDERITPELKEEIEALLKKNDSLSAYAVPRRNYYFGREMSYGGAWPDYVKRLFKRESLKEWQGGLHEEPVFGGKLGHLKAPLLHFSHRDLTSMLNKTRDWSKIEADLLLQAGHPPITWWRIGRIMIGELWQRLVKLQGYRDGTEGWLEAIFQMFSRFITYARLWEYQRSKKAEQ